MASREELEARVVTGRTRRFWGLARRRWRTRRLRRGHCIVADALHGVDRVARLDDVREADHLEDGPVRLRVLEFGAKPEASWAEGRRRHSKRRPWEDGRFESVALFPEYFPHRGRLGFGASLRRRGRREVRRLGREGRRTGRRGRRGRRRRGRGRRERGRQNWSWARGRGELGGTRK